MAACVVSDARLDCHEDVYWDPRHNFPQGHWDDLLSHFLEVELFARVRVSRDRPPEHMKIPAQVRIRRAPYYQGAAAALRVLPATLAKVWDVTANDRLFILRGPGLHAVWCSIALSIRRKRYLVELLGDPGEAYRFSSLPFRSMLGPLFEKLTRLMVRNADAVLYVVGHLQEKYPAREAVPTAVITDARLSSDIFHEPRERRGDGELRLVMVANMEQPYKGHEHLLAAVAILAQRKVDVRVRLIGDGRLRPEYERLAEEFGVAGRVQFLGAVPWGTPVFDVLDESDLFIMTSLTEGLPKALLEAMARGLPAVATTVGGFPQVLPSYALFAPADPYATADKIAAFAVDAAARRRLAWRCYRTAQRYQAAEIGVQRAKFYDAVERRFSVSPRA